MKYIVGIGNPGEKYSLNRHNAGILLVDYLKKNVGIENKIKLLKSENFMNSSGLSVRKYIEYYDIDLNDLYIAHDDLDLPLGQYKIQKGVGPKKHNGISSINSATGNINYYRIRIGIENRETENRIPGEVFVLENFRKDELKVLDETFGKIIKEL